MDALLVAPITSLRMARPNSETAGQSYSPDALHRYGVLTPLFWHGLRLGAFFKLLARNQFRCSPREALTAVTITPVAAFNSVWSAVQAATLNRRIERLELREPPLFVLGHWRSGTTLLHELLIRDPDHTYPTTYECFAPYHFLLTESWITPLTKWMLPKKRPMDNVAAGWDRPQEDEFALCSLGVPSPYLCWAFPDHGPVYPEYLTLENLSDQQRAEWKRNLRFFVQSVAYRRNRRIVLKSPPHTARVRTLLEIYPDARFVHIVRDPLTLYPSTVRLWKSLCDVQSLQWPRAEYDWLEEHVLDNLVRMYAAFERDRKLIPPGRLAELRYEDLVRDPQEQLRTVYEKLDLGDFSRVEPTLHEFKRQNHTYRTNRYQLPPEIEKKVRERWAMYFERYGYETSGVVASST